MTLYTYLCRILGRVLRNLISHCVNYRWKWAISWSLVHVITASRMRGGGRSYYWQSQGNIERFIRYICSGWSLGINVLYVTIITGHLQDGTNAAQFFMYRRVTLQLTELGWFIISFVVKVFFLRSPPHPHPPHTYTYEHKCHNILYYAPIIAPLVPGAEF